MNVMTDNLKLARSPVLSSRAARDLAPKLADEIERLEKFINDHINTFPVQLTKMQAVIEAARKIGMDFSWIMVRSAQGKALYKALAALDGSEEGKG